MPTPTANRFALNLQTTDDIRDADIAFQMDVRFLWGGDSMMVVRNCRYKSFIINMWVGD